MTSAMNILLVELVSSLVARTKPIGLSLKLMEEVLCSHKDLHLDKSRADRSSRSTNDSTFELKAVISQLVSDKRHQSQATRTLMESQLFSVACKEVSSTTQCTRRTFQM